MSSSSFFRGIRVTSFGPSSVLKIDSSIPMLSPSPSQVLIRIHAAGVNPVDTYIRSGKYAGLPQLPYTPGKDGAGVVEAVGAGVTSVKKGDRVYTISATTGTYAEYSLSEQQFVHPLNKKASFEQGACIGVPYFTAYRALFQRGKSVKGDTVLIHGASGGVGIACVQMAKQGGLKVIGTASTEEGKQLVKSIGADFVLDHSTPEHFAEVMKITESKGVNLIVEMLANANLGNDLPILAKNGSVAIVGSRGPVEINPRDLMGKETHIFGVMLGGCTTEELHEIAAAVDRGFEEGHIHPVVDKAMPVEQAMEAHDYVVPSDKPSSGATGRIVLTISGP